jgi:hypothetical protein
MADHLRLGLVRRNKRDYSVHLRPYGKNAFDRLKEKKLISLRQLLLSFIVLIIDDVKQKELCEVSLLAYFTAGLELKSITTPFLGTVDQISGYRVSLRSFTEQTIERLTGFKSVEICKMRDAFGLPDFFTLNTGKLLLF